LNQGSYAPVRGAAEPAPCVHKYLIAHAFFVDVVSRCA
jgi:hypothetical protein